tara:strand:- start:158 stop:925 length:768 start_codon:yes stop_codon:yes gene_type:complete
MKNQNFSIIIQLRNGSSRLPYKALYTYKNKTLIEIMIKRILKIFKRNQIYLITTKLKQDDILIEICQRLKIKTFRGDKDNVLKRFIQSASKFKIENIIRLTGDCPLIDPNLIYRMKEKYFSQKFDYYSNCYPYTERYFPVGSDIEIFKTKVINFIGNSKPTKFEKEHVTSKILKFKNKFKCGILKSNKDYSKIRYTIDYYKDYEVIIEILKYLDKKKFFGTYVQISKFLLKNPKLLNYNKKFVKQYYKTKIKYKI